jgi:hypothetical protein
MAKVEISRSDLVQFLNSIPLFSGVAEEILKRIVRHSRIRRMERGELLFNQTDPADPGHSGWEGIGHQ